MKRILMNRPRIIYCAFATALISGLAVSNTLAQDKAKSGATPKPSLKSIDEYLKGIDRRIDVTPQTPVDGIKTGLVIVFGHVIKGPYRIEFGDHKMLVNGIVVDPSPVKQRQFKHPMTTPEELSRAHEVTDFTHRAQAIYREEKDSIPDEVLQKKILDFVKSQKGVKDARWEGKSYLSVKLAEDKYDSYGYGIMFSKAPAVVEPPETAETRAARTKSIQAHYLEELEGDLRRGKSLFFLSDGGVFHDYLDVRKKVNAIMLNTQLSQDEKIKQLRESVFEGNLGAALDVAANYHADEWKVEGH